MQRGIWLSAILIAFAMPGLSGAQQTSQSTQTSQSIQTSQPPPSDKQAVSQSKAAAQAAPQTTPAKTDSLAEAARKARAAEKNAPKATIVFTNDNIPSSSSGVSVVGNSAASSDQTTSSAAQAPEDKNDEATWRKKFADARQKIDQDKQELSIMQRELGELNVQYYTDPTQAMQQSYSRSDITDKQNAIDAKQKELAADEQALSNLEDELRKAGGDPGWARE